MEIMEGVKRLEEKIAETKDPIVRKQLQELLDKRRKREKKTQKVILILIIMVFLYLFTSTCIKIYFEGKIHQLELEHIQWQREMLDD